MRRVLLLNIQFFNKYLEQKRTYCVGGCHKATTADIKEIEKVKPKTQKLFRVKNGESDICGRSKSQTFTL